MKFFNATDPQKNFDPVEFSKIIRRKRLLELTGISRSTSYLKANPKSNYFDPKFPRSVQIGTNSVGWRLGEVLNYIDSLATSKTA